MLTSLSSVARVVVVELMLPGVFFIACASLLLCYFISDGKQQPQMRPSHPNYDLILLKLCIQTSHTRVSLYSVRG